MHFGRFLEEFGSKAYRNTHLNTSQILHRVSFYMRLMYLVPADSSFLNTPTIVIHLRARFTYDGLGEMNVTSEPGVTVRMTGYAGSRDYVGNL